MSVLGKLLVKSTTRAIKNTAKFELAVDDLIEKFSEACPPKDQLLEIVRQKNQIQSALSNVLGEFSKVNSIVDTTKTIVTTVGTAVKIIKAIPLPTSFPPGVGIPINVITLLADSLDTLGDLVKGAKASLKIVPPVAKTITSSAELVLNKLATLDGVLNVCIEALLNDLEWSKDVEYNIGDQVTYKGDYYGSQIEPNFNIPPIPETVPVSWTLSDATSALNWLMNQIGNVAASSGASVDTGLNIADDKLLLDRLDPNSNNPLFYKKSGFPNKDWKLTIEYNPNNDFTFPQRRIKAENLNKYSGNPFKGITVYNLYGKKYSYSTSVAVLIDEVRFVIEQLDTNWYKQNNPEFNTSGTFDQNANFRFNYQGIGENTLGENAGLSSTLNTASLPPPSPLVPIQFIAENLKENGTETKKIIIPTNINSGVLNVIAGKVVTTNLSQSIEIVVDTGTNFSFGSGNQNQPAEARVEFTPDILKSLNNYTYPDLAITYATAYDEEYVKRFTYNEPGEYTFKLRVLHQYGINTTANGKTYLRLEQ
tara:strand:+ start:274 stop:1881 length:1608 start_codon:yes stop_codon:yes gene_type:complete